MKFGETVADTAKREIFEETRIKIEVIRPELAYVQRFMTQHRDLDAIDDSLHDRHAMVLHVAATIVSSEHEKIVSEVQDPLHVWASSDLSDAAFFHANFLPDLDEEAKKAIAWAWGIVAAEVWNV